MTANKDAPAGRVPIDDAKRIAVERRCPVVVVFALHGDDNQYSLASYGMTRPLCKLGASFASQIAACIADGRIEAPQQEPPESELWTLLKELDVEMDGVRVSASAAAILNRVRTLLEKAP